MSRTQRRKYEKRAEMLHEGTSEERQQSDGHSIPITTQQNSSQAPSSLEASSAKAGHCSAKQKRPFSPQTPLWHNSQCLPWSYCSQQKWRMTATVLGLDQRDAVSPGGQPSTAVAAAEWVICSCKTFGVGQSPSQLCNTEHVLDLFHGFLVLS